MSVDAKAIDKLVKLKKQIEQAKLDKASAEGALKQCLDRLKIDFACKSIDQAKKKLEEMKKKQEELEEDIEAALKELEEEYDL